MRENPKACRFMSMQPVSMNRSPHDIRQYWTPERKKAAVPAPMGIVTAAPRMPEAANEEPATDPKQADLAKMPFTAGGKLFFTMDNVDYVASANIFMHRNMLLTAAHCIQNNKTGNVGENFVFEQCYTGEESSEDFSIKTVALKENWYLVKDYKFDFAIAILDKNSDFAEPLRYSVSPDMVGKTVVSMGYPVSYFDGDQMMFAKGPISTRTGQEGHWIMMGSKMGPGSSGGAWVLEDGLTAVGLNAYIVKSGEEIMYSGSPQFNEDFEKLYQYALTLM